MTQDSFTDLHFKIEAILFSYGDYISLREIQQTLDLDSEMMAKNALQDLQEKYKEGYSFHIVQNEDGKYRMSVKDDYADLLSDMISGTEIPANVLKVLSVIAYEQPVTKTRLSEILGKSVKNEVNYLYRNKFLSYQKQGIGKYYKVTKKFYDYFKLEEGEDFRDAANKSITTFLEEVPQPIQDTQEESTTISEEISNEK
ncbi:MAG: SMC-Scp complex subunit ScpB [Nanoarchaeota archaeon]|nr:SMC-Scp complex subunit ScpB [Nanoarchaeota archaeon]MEC8339356.1 SMC-Scp complex subunit ScpB [Nanoarchaeota archaeon]